MKPFSQYQFAKVESFYLREYNHSVKTELRG